MRLENTACLLFWLLTSAAIAQAQIVADGSLGTRVSGPSNGIVISDGFRNGQNLFHSFDSFSVNVGEVASFAESLGVSRILARVTGPNRSEIQGILRAQSDLYLMNPNGVLFGEGATLEVNGLFVATTVDSIKLGESGEFSVSQRGDLSLLTFDAPEAFGFSGDRIAAPIEVTTLLSAQGSVTLVGGDILVRGGTAGLEIDSGDITLNAGGRVTLEGASPRASDKGSISTNGRVVIRAGELQMENFDISTGEGSPSMDIDIAGDMSMRPASTIRSKSGDIAVRAGGDMNLTVAQIMLEGSGSTLTVTAEGDLMLTGLGTSGNNPSLIQANVTGSESGADVTVNVRGDIRLEGRNTMIGVESSEGSSGTLGNVQVVADGNIDLSSRARISSEVNGSGGGGDLSVQAGGDILLDDRGSIIARSSEQSSGQLGSVSVEAADELVLSNRAEISALTQGSGKGGDIHVKAGGLLIDGGGLTTVIGEEVTPLATGILAKTFAPEGGGQGGNIDISIEGQAWLRNGGLIDSSTAGDGNGGAIFFRASDLSIDGRDQSGNNFMFSTGITAFTENLEIPNAGRGGDINVSLRQGGALQIFNGGQIDTSSFGGVGVAGNVSISFDQSQGSIFIDKGGAERFTGIGSDTSGNGNAGFVAVNTGTLSILNGGLISTGVFDSRNGQASTGNGGDITVTANTMLVKGASPPDPPDQQGGSVIGNSAIYAGTRTGTAGRSGTIHVITTSGDLRLEDGGVIGVESHGQGEAGSLLVEAYSDIRLDGYSRLTVASAEADAGDLRIHANRDVLVSESTITAQAGVQGEREATGRGGNVAMDGRILALRNASTITAQAVKGAGGNIDVETDYLLANNIERQVSASSEFGVDGKIRIDSVFDLSESLPRLDERLLSETEEVEDLDPSKVPEDHSTFVPNGGSGGIPIDPGSYLPSLKLWDLPLGE